MKDFIMICISDMYINGILVCKEGKSYIVKPTQDSVDEGYYDILNCEDGSTVGCTCVDLAKYFI